ncbi:Mechanosensitive ion channel [Marinobacter daqiaonensis]|uniref:Small-conductance mechanosensitive channel n=1 Tax=Marinobacter daqiaonensis TaxID=650891 RepID=A0A1I6ICW3_9GAMM|nr:mechanosensitive ion channel family protein [Marinobacter daqiaonensis]SFR64541.1 Mechanosensitive ion channel [Marinobacter daqiaonensis]
MWSNLQDQLLSNLSDTADALGIAEMDWQHLLVWMSGQLLVTFILLVLAALLYGLLELILKLAIGRRRALNSIYLAVKRGLQYLVTLFVVIAVVAQYGGDAALLKSIARGGLMAMGFYVGWVLVAQTILKTLHRYRIDPSLEQLLKNSLSVMFLVLGAVTVLAQFGFDVWSIIAGLGIVGIAVGFAAQSTLSNFIAGVTLLIERPFRIGDWVRINDQEGRVQKIAFRTTWLRTRDNIFTMIPNDNVASSEIVNFSAEGPTRIRIKVGIAYKESAQAARDAILPVLAEHPKVLQEPDMMPRVRMEALGDSSIDLEVLAWIRREDIDTKARIASEILEGIKSCLDEAGIQIPFPHLQLFIDDAKGLKPLVSPLRIKDEGGTAANNP